MLTLSTLIFTSCAKKGGIDGSAQQDEKSIFSRVGDFFSNRQITPTTALILIQLKEPALLRDATIVDGKAVINQNLKKTIIEEQEALLEKLSQISSDIKVVAKYQLVLNAVAVTVPSQFVTEVGQLSGVEKVVETSFFKRPTPILKVNETVSVMKNLNDKTSVQFIGADEAHELGIKGSKMRVGVIDTGIDYTHKMLGGTGNPEHFKSINPDTVNEHFPNDKIVGGMDFVGTTFNAASSKAEDQIPKRDPNPIDEAEHGTHVAGSVAGIGDGVNTYSGVAPDAKMYSLKVFGKDGSTNDVAVISALEYAADPSEQMEVENRLDVVNLSLGGGYGKPKILYNEAISNLTRAGTVVVASAGNSGDEPYIVGAPSTSDAAISVAASIDNLDQNILFNAIEFNLDNKKFVVDLFEGDIGVPASTSKVSGELVYIGNGGEEISESQKALVKNKVALMVRGGILNGEPLTFAKKMEAAKSVGAIGVVMINNKDDEPIAMGGSKVKYDFPAVMITKAMGQVILKALADKQIAKINFSSEEKISHPERADLITSFSSRGPRSIDSLIKPEIAAPGALIISAETGSGVKGQMMSGTSMAAPHMAGVMALIKEAKPNLSVAELKALVMNTSKILFKKDKLIPVSLQGAGRVQVKEAIKSPVLAMPASLSLGEVPVAGIKSVNKKILIKNISNEDVVLNSSVLKNSQLSVSIPASVKVKANASTIVTVVFTFTNKSTDKQNTEMDGFIKFTSTKGEVINLPYLGIKNIISNIQAGELKTHTDSEEDKIGSSVSLELSNNGKNSGDALIFNLLGKSERKLGSTKNLSKNVSCDLEAAGVRVVEKEVEGKSIKSLQFGIKLYDMLSMWQPCDVSIQFDVNNDNTTDYELVGTLASNIPGLSVKMITSILFDAEAARAIRLASEKGAAKENYTSSILDVSPMAFYDHSSVAVVEVDMSKILVPKNGQARIKLAVTSLEADGADDDFVQGHEKEWEKISLHEKAFTFTDMPEVVKVQPGDTEIVNMTRGAGKDALLVLFPHNVSLTEIGYDKQSKILKEKFLKVE